jgi:hypothetical protein
MSSYCFEGHSDVDAYRAVAVIQGSMASASVTYPVTDSWYPPAHRREPRNSI